MYDKYGNNINYVYTTILRIKLVPDHVHVVSIVLNQVSGSSRSVHTTSGDKETVIGMFQVEGLSR